MKTKPKILQRLINLDAQIVTFIVASLFLVAAQAADLSHGEELFEDHCAACHTVIESVRDKSGPNLSGVYGRKAGTEDYSGGYSEQMAALGVTWEMGTLQAFVFSPAMMVRGTKMVFRGLAEAEARTDLVCYLERVAKSADASLNDLCAEGRQE
jgi:cytochrome c